MGVTERPEGRRLRGDRGFTLPELLITIAITAIILPAITAAVIVALRTTGDAGDAFGEAYDSELVVSYFVPDAQSANLIGSADAVDTPCDSLEHATDIMRLRGVRFASGYRLAGHQLIRWSGSITDVGGEVTCSTIRTHVLADHVEHVTAYSDAPHQVALAIETESGNRYSVSATQRTGNVDLNHRPDVTFTWTCEYLFCQVAAQASDPDGQITSYSWDWGDGSLLDTGPTADHTYPANGTYTISVTVTDDAGATDTASQTVTVRANQAPVVGADSYLSEEDVVLSVPAPGVLGNDSDPDGDPIMAAIATPPSHGTLTWDDPNSGGRFDGSFTFTPDENWFGTDTFTYTVTDIAGATSDPATVTITVNPADDAPLAVPDAYSTNEDVALTVGVPGVLANDVDAEGSILSVLLVSEPSVGTLDLHLGTDGKPDGGFTYTPEPNWHGTDGFTYKANDGANDSNTATVTITVASVNDGPPVVADDVYSTDEDTRLTVGPPGVLGNDSDPDYDDVMHAELTDPPSADEGTVALNDDGSFTFDPASNFNGDATFTYAANDGALTSTLVATVTIHVAAVNDAPVAGADPYLVYEDGTLSVPPLPLLLANDEDVEQSQGELTAIKVTDPEHGTITAFNADGSFIYVPNADYNGPDSFTYKANDGIADSNVATVTITVTPTNDAPVAVDDTYTGATEDEVYSSSPAQGVLANDEDMDGDDLTAVLVAQADPNKGTVALDPDDGSFTFTPAADFNGTASFTYKANDGAADSNVATVTIIVGAVNDPPLAENDHYTTPEDSALLQNAVQGVLANDEDIDDAHSDLIAVVVAQPAAGQGAVALDGDGSFTFTPGPDFNGDAIFTYKANDGDADSNVATVTINVAAINDPPVADDDHYTTPEDEALVRNAAQGVLANDDDPEGELTAVKLTDPLHGVLEAFGSDGSFTYRPAGHWFGSDLFTYRVTDSDGITDDAVVYIEVTSVNDPPVASFTAVVRCQGAAPATCDVFVDGSTSSDVEDGTIAASGFSWDWGDGSVPTNGVRTAAHVYTQHNEKIITLTVRDSGGLTDTESHPITPPVLTSSHFSFFGVSVVRLNWSGLSGPVVDIYRDPLDGGSAYELIANNVPMNPAQWDRVGWKSYAEGTYKVCEDGGTKCTNPSTQDW